ncbi:MAG TPA: SCO family protein [Anaerolineales bacterium]|nr:SCO family protein [Anaerolineales bacterium]HMX73557.1 SCO family protein [Anaerolineales bacterium]HMZ42991.1 SCO family protein [Anaerolineales bacterium]HNA53561.1 SCO family protein [Anaerolineales bacterium]HNB86028.1 SCO family protein [Anaerolineales bacterium]
MDKRITFVGLASLGIVALAFVLNIFFLKPASFRGALYGEPYPRASEIELPMANGQTFRLTEQHGKVILLFFGYTSCPDVCPTTLAEMKMVMDQLGDDGSRVQVVFVSVDPERDTPEKIQTYVEHFNPAFIGLSGSSEQLEPVWQAYSIFREAVQSDSAFGVIINHTARLFLVDSQGNLRLSYAYQTPVDDIVHDIKLLLEREP